MAADMFSSLKVGSWASAHADCPMRYRITGTDETVIIFGRGGNEFEFALDAGALRNLVRLGAEALHELSTDTEKTEIDECPSA